jgi:hypothetical protein
MVVIKSNTQLLKEEQELIQKAEAESIELSTSKLAQYVRSVWEDAKESKDTVEDIMEENIRQRNGIYNPDKLASIQAQGGSEIFMMLTDEKCTALKAWLYDLLLPPNDEPYTTDPTPVPELPEDHIITIEEQARKELIQGLMQAQQLGTPIPEAEIQLRMEELISEVQNKIKRYAEKFDNNIRTKINDILIEGGWQEEFCKALDDVVDLPAGILKGPIIESGKELQWEQDAEGKYVPVVEDALQVKYRRVSPFDIYPVGASTDIDDGDLFEKHRLSLKELGRLRNVEGYDSETISAILVEAHTGKYSNWSDEDHDQDTSLNLEQQEDETVDDWLHQYGKKIEALQFWGAVQGKLLAEWGVDIPEDKMFEIFDTEIWLIDKFVIKAKVNSNPLGLKPYYKASFRNRNGSFWGESLPQTIRDIQDVCNASARSLVNNMAISSGPQVGIDLSKIAEGMDTTSMYPWKLWQFDEQEVRQGGAGGRQPLWFFQPDSNAEQLMRVYEFFSKEADNKTGVPRYSYGTGGNAAALGTATGISMMMNNASKGVKQVVKNIDLGITEPSVRAAHTYIMLWEEDELIKGDIKIVAKGSKALMAREQQQMRLNEALNIAMSPIGLQLLGEEGLAVLVKHVFKGLDADIEDIVPTIEEIRARKIANPPLQQEEGSAPSAPANNINGGANLFQQKPMG